MTFTNLNQFLAKVDIDTPKITRWLLPVLCAGLFVYYAIFSVISPGYYQHDELGHLMQILGFWKAPLVYLTDPWSRGGYKILYAIPTLFGYHAVIGVNILFTVCTAWLSYRICKAYDLKYSWLAIVLTGLQPFVINLSFRCYAEIPAMFFTTLLVYLYVKQKWTWVAVTASYLFTVRAELVVFAVLLGVLFLVQKKWIPFLLLGIAPIILNILGFCLNGDPLYVVHMMVQGGLKDTYLRMGFWYFWLMLPEISGITIIFLFLNGYLALLYWGKDRWKMLKKYHAVFLVFTIYFLLHCAFTSQSFGFGRSGGVGRFMLVILPMVSIIGLIGVNFWVSDQNKSYKTFIASIALLVLLVLLWKIKEVLPLVYNGYKTIRFADYNKAALAVLFILAITLIHEPEGRNVISATLAILIAIYAIRCVSPVELIGEDKNLVTAVTQFCESTTPPAHIYANHPVATYECDKQLHNYDKVTGYDATTVTQAHTGDVFIYETHYTEDTLIRQLLAPANFKVLQKVDSFNKSLPAYIVQKK